MKKTLLIALIAIAFTACKKEADFSKIKPGMKSSEVTELVGEPNQKQEMAIAGTYWNYDTHLVVIQADTVAECLSQEDYKKRMTEFNEGMEKLQKEMKQEAE